MLTTCRYTRQGHPRRPSGRETEPVKDDGSGTSNMAALSNLYGNETYQI
jgi:hypothetical protein